ncbi:MAG: tRNA (adenosine(37)-N6)-threonylcarbamoyltransferase complex transferase subunit TsaD [Candidatus Electronema sp. V4]|uniref:tRNA (adenosine(37)-N6)-threonylcarbamoyltransferase complex transferase subunit TsaD n=1 Tax=Candidatus Electronema sp. V4 TaxID=3454756 RepID=UPI0040556658
MLILAIESSCDDTAAAVLEDGSRVLANVISSQHSVHEKYGGVVPELASRCHIEAVWPVAEEALRQAGATLDEIDLIAATQGPGLVGCLLVGFTFAKSLALVRNIPCVGVDHLAGHLLAILLEENKPAFPYTALVASGGTSSLFAVSSPTEFRLLGRTRDDAPGEAFDKVAKMLNLGCPGGPAVSQRAEQGRSDAFAFPRALADGSVDFSFSGLKTAVMNQIKRFQQADQPVPVDDICASFEQAVADALTEKTIRAAKRAGHRQVVLGGGVAANRRLRQQMAARCAEEGLTCFLPSPAFCTDNAAMIGLAGWHLFQAGQRVGPDADAFSRSPLN